MKMRVSLCAVLLAVAAGCGDSGPPLVPVAGTVTLNGEPIQGATLSFAPDPTNKFGRPARGVSGPQGKYKSTTSGRPGVVPGKYLVVVSQDNAGAPRVEGQYSKEVPPSGATIDFEVIASSEPIAGGKR